MTECSIRASLAGIIVRLSERVTVVTAVDGDGLVEAVTVMMPPRCGDRLWLKTLRMIDMMSGEQSTRSRSSEIKT